MDRTVPCAWTVSDEEELGPPGGSGPCPSRRPGDRGTHLHGARPICCSSVLENKGYTEAGRAFLERVTHSSRSTGEGSASRERLKAEQGAGVTRKWSIPHLTNQRFKTERSILKSIVVSVCPWLEGAVCRTAPSVSLPGVPSHPFTSRVQQDSPDIGPE